MSYKIAFFGAKPYDIASFDKVNEKYNYDIKYFKGHLNPNNVVLTQGADAVNPIKPFNEKLPSRVRQ